MNDAAPSGWSSQNPNTINTRGGYAQNRTMDPNNARQVQMANYGQPQPQPQQSFAPVSQPQIQAQPPAAMPYHGHYAAPFGSASAGVTNNPVAGYRHYPSPYYTTPVIPYHTTPVIPHNGAMCEYNVGESSVWNHPPGEGIGQPAAVPSYTGFPNNQMNPHNNGANWGTNYPSSIPSSRIPPSSIPPSSIPPSSIPPSSIPSSSIPSSSIPTSQPPSAAGIPAFRPDFSSNQVAGYNVARYSVDGHSVVGYSVVGYSVVGYSVARYSVAKDCVAGVSSCLGSDRKLSNSLATSSKTPECLVLAPRDPGPDHQDIDVNTARVQPHLSTAPFSEEEINLVSALYSEWLVQNPEQ
ncbi:hypothetical protein F5883DRAFT_707050 [Diaporthe sp. PMI_573]|nr:hypothetical protein F5883DRAFT_707050 [Diaporthaceae sp. PMI_573]